MGCGYAFPVVPDDFGWGLDSVGRERLNVDAVQLAGPRAQRDFTEQQRKDDAGGGRQTDARVAAVGHELSLFRARGDRDGRNSRRQRHYSKMGG
jgi:hypothetical protein